jgi:hypothetical protein
MLNSAVGQQLQQAREQAMQHRLANRPRLLTAHVEDLVANYYEMANMIDSQVGGAGRWLQHCAVVRCVRQLNAPAGGLYLHASSGCLCRLRCLFGKGMSVFATAWKRYCFV